MGKNRNRGGGRSQKDEKKGSGVSDRDYKEHLLKCFEEAYEGEDVYELGYIEEVIVQKYCERMLEMFPEILDTLPEMATSPGSPWYIKIKEDLCGPLGMGDARLKEIIMEKFERLQKKQPFIRKTLFIYWMLKIEYNESFKEQLQHVCKADIPAIEKEKKFQNILDSFYTENDFDKMSVEEVQWYCQKYQVTKAEDERQIFLKEVVNEMSNTKKKSLEPVFGAPDNFVLEILNKTVNYGVDARIKELHLRQADEVSTDLKKAEQEMSTILGKMEEMKKILESRDKVIDDLKRQIVERTEEIQSLEKQICKLTKKSLSDYVPIPHDRLLSKCLEFAGEVKSLDVLSQKILRNENYDETTVDTMADELCLRIQAHLNLEAAPIWNKAFLKKHTNRKFSHDKATKAVDDLLKFVTNN